MNNLNIQDWGQLKVLEVALFLMEEALTDMDLFDPTSTISNRTLHQAELDNTLKLQGALAQLRNQMLSAMEK